MYLEDLYDPSRLYLRGGSGGSKRLEAANHSQGGVLLRQWEDHHYLGDMSELKQELAGLDAIIVAGEREEPRPQVGASSKEKANAIGALLSTPQWTFIPVHCTGHSGFFTKTRALLLMPNA